MLRNTIAATLILSCLGLTDASAEEKISIKSFTPGSSIDFRKRVGPAVTVPGSLYLPAQLPGPLPAMILKHGSGSLESATGDNIRKWATSFAGWGIAALVVDSFGPRQIKETATNQAQLSLWADTADSFAALAVLAADPRIDKTRIGIIGWSRGGTVAIHTALEEARKASNIGGLRFAAHIVVYGAGMTQFRGAATDKSPFLFLHGEADDYAPMPAIREYAYWLKTKGNPVAFVSYPGAHHDFDVEGGFQGFAKTLESFANCDKVFNMADSKMLRMNGKPNPSPTLDQFNAYQRSCVTRGATLKFSAEARAAAIEQVHAFIKNALKMGG